MKDLLLNCFDLTLLEISKKKNNNYFNLIKLFAFNGVFISISLSFFTKIFISSGTEIGFFKLKAL